jgi:hypothetical protein
VRVAGGTVMRELVVKFDMLYFEGFGFVMLVSSLDAKKLRPESVDMPTGKFELLKIIEFGNVT